MTERTVKRIFGILLVILIVAAGFGQAVHQLWNWVVPEVFGFHTITYWQSLGLLLLCWTLFGGFRGMCPSRSWGGGPRRGGPWNPMTPEEREKFRQGMRGGCGPFGSAAAEPKS